jgi:hypothetical protein
MLWNSHHRLIENTHLSLNGTFEPANKNKNPWMLRLSPPITHETTTLLLFPLLTHRSPVYLPPSLLMHSKENSPNKNYCSGIVRVKGFTTTTNISGRSRAQATPSELLRREAEVFHGFWLLRVRLHPYGRNSRVHFTVSGHLRLHAVPSEQPKLGTRDSCSF